MPVKKHVAPGHGPRHDRYHGPRHESRQKPTASYSTRPRRPRRAVNFDDFELDDDDDEGLQLEPDDDGGWD